MEKEKPKIFQNRYEKIVQIGKGSFGTVYLIWDKKGNIKSLKELLDNKEEINLLAIKKSINNENFVFKKKIKTNFKK